MSITPASISLEILSNIDEVVILLNTAFKVVTINNKASELLKTQTNFKEMHISNFISEYEKITLELKKLKKENLSSFSCRAHFIVFENEKVLMDAKFKLLMDKYNDLVGYLIIANEVKEIKLLKVNFNITDRETSVIQQIIAGKTNQEISEELFITESTVKSHITNIFNKLGIDNRVQLMMLLKDFKLIPDQPADKILFIKDK
jgi:DNA-binding CsgD family transcriptional regulator